MKSTKAYSIIELMVVLSIFLVLSTIGITALITNRNINKLNGVAEQLKSDLRRAQLNALTIEGDCANPAVAGKPKAWAVFVGSIGGRSGYEMRYWCDEGGANGTWYSITHGSAPFPLSADSDVYYFDNNITATGDVESWYIFATPLGSYYRVVGNDGANPGLMGLGNDFKSFAPPGATSATGTILLTGTSNEKSVIIGDQFGFVEVR